MSTQQARSYKSQRQHTRRDFTPLTVSCELECTTPQSPLAQTSNALNTEFEPDRKVSPTVVRPRTTVIDPDGIYGNGINNAHLSSEEHKWFLNSRPISELWQEGSDKDYEILKTADEDNGSLKIYKNITAGDVYALSYEGMFNDFRTGTNYVVESTNSAVLTTTDKGSDEYKCQVENNDLIYDPSRDRLLVFEYEKGLGMPTNGTRDDYIDGKSYQRTVEVLLTHGQETLTKLPDGVEMRICEKGSDTAIVPSTTDNPEIISATFPNITVDLRWYWHKELDVKFFNKATGRELCSDSIKMTRELPMLTPQSLKPKRGNDIATQQTMYYNCCEPAWPGRIIGYPELYYEIQWFTQARKPGDRDGSSVYAEPVKRNIGTNMQCKVSELGLGTKKELAWMDVGFDVYERETASILQSEDGGSYLTDEAGNILII